MPGKSRRGDWECLFEEEVDFHVDSTHGSQSLDLSYVTILFLITQPFTHI